MAIVPEKVDNAKGPTAILSKGAPTVGVDTIEPAGLPKNLESETKDRATSTNYDPNCPEDPLPLKAVVTNGVVSGGGRETIPAREHCATSDKVTTGSLEI